MSEYHAQILCKILQFFCEFFFHQPVESNGSDHDIIPDIIDLRDVVMSVADMYNDSISDRRGIYFYLPYQCKRDAQMITEWRTVSLGFVRHLKIFIWRPVLKEVHRNLILARKYHYSCSCLSFWWCTSVNLWNSADASLCSAKNDLRICRNEQILTSETFP